ncbi:MAG TPA: hypothetical protein VOA87_07015, partial [Thermoanaerobaculia bacterium]|nr:hypothetical protein [Thermoanaerobaculia bacterium]
MNLQRVLSLSLCAAALGAAGPVASQMQPPNDSALSRLAFADPRLAARPSIAPIAQVQGLPAEVAAGWSGFRGVAAGEWRAFVDRRNGHLEFAEGAGFPWIPGHGNALTAADIAAFLGGRSAVDLAALERIARSFLSRNAELLGVDPKELVLARGRSGRIADYLWFVDFDVHRGGLAVEGARVVFRVNNGNLIQFGSENLPPLGVPAPPAKIAREDALRKLAGYVGALHATDRFVDSGSLHLLPAVEGPGFELGKGRGLVAVWQFTFKRDGVMGTWRGRVDATTGDLLDFRDVNDYAQATGGVYPNSPALDTEIVLPMPFADVSAGGPANSAGLFSYNGVGAPVSHLLGPYVRIADTCGPVSASGDADGNIAFGTSVGTDCTTPGSGGTGNTHSARMQFYHVNRIKEVGRGWLPANSWLTQPLTVNVNLNQTCNAYWDGTALNFFKSGGGCGNTGEIAGISLHEWGHGLDQNDGDGPDNQTGEAYADTTATIATHLSCMGPGFFGHNCTGYGDACTSCTGVRDIDFAKHASNTPATVDNFTRPHCQIGAGGPCGGEVHCESYVATETIWDFANRDLPSPGSGGAWSILDRLWYLSRPTAGNAFECNTSNPTFTSDGCIAGSWWRTMRAVDDDDGNLANGTPHGGALFAAFNRHGIACPGDPGASTTFAGCTPPAVPTVTLTPGDTQVQVAWTDSGPGTTYDVYRNEAGCNAGFIRIASEVAATNYLDTTVANGMTYYYQVIVHASGNTACAAAPTACGTTSLPTVPCTPPAAPAGLTATTPSTNTVGLSWSAVAGATAYRIYRGTMTGGPYSLVASVAAPTTTYQNVFLPGGSTFFYVVRAFLGCESGNSNEAQATVTGGVCATGTLYSNGFESGSGLADWTVATFLNAGPTADWRGIQTCTAQTGTHVFRFGGATCSASYGNSQWNVAVPSGATGIPIPIGASGTTLTFGHHFDFESGFDGGTLLISLDGVNYSSIPGTALTGAGYNHTISAACPPAGAAGLPSFSATQSAFVNTTVDLDAACNAASGGSDGCSGKTVRVGFGTVADCSGGGFGWFLDNVAVSSCVFPVPP